VDQEFFVDRQVPVEHSHEEIAVDIPAAQTPVTDVKKTAPDPSAFEKRRLRLKQQFLAAVNMTDEAITDSKRNEVHDFFGYSTIGPPPDAKDDTIPQKYTSSKKNPIAVPGAPKAKQTVSECSECSITYVISCSNLSLA
jgi:hypothetical protein